MKQPCKCGHNRGAHSRRKQKPCSVQWCACLRYGELSDRDYARLFAWIGRVLARCKAEPGSACVRWIGSTNACNHYGRCRVSVYYAGLDVNGKRPKVVGAHRVLYSLVRGSIPPHYHLDHTCENRWCVNPYHLEAMTQTQNNRLAVRTRDYGPRATLPPELDEWASYAEPIL